MALEIINRIKDAESRAKVKLEEANAHAEDMINKAKNKAEDMINKANAAAEAIIKQSESNAKAETEKDALKIEEKWSKKIQVQTDSANKNIDSAVNIVIEEITKAK